MTGNDGLQFPDEDTGCAKADAMSAEYAIVPRDDLKPGPAFRFIGSAKANWSGKRRS